MKKRIDLNLLFENMGNDMDFGDGDAARIWDAASSRKKPRRPKRVWLIPAAAAATVLISLLAVPQARAEMLTIIGNLFDIMDYLNTDADSRPDNTAVADLIQRDVPAVVTVTQAQGEANAWVNSLKLHIDEAVCDGHSVVMKLKIECPEIGDLDLYMAPAGKNETVNYKCCEILGIKVLSGRQPSQLSTDYWIEKERDGVWTGTLKFNSDQFDFNGTERFSIPISLSNKTATMDADGQVKESSSPAGKADLTFSLDASAGAMSARTIGGLGGEHALSGNAILTRIDFGSASNTFTNETVSFDGCRLSILSVVQTPVETSVKVQVSAPRFIQENQGFTIELLDGDRVVGRTASSYGGDGVMIYRVTAPFVPSDVKKLTVHVKLSYFTECGGRKINPDQPVTVPDSDTGYHVREQDIDGGTIEIDMTR